MSLELLGDPSVDMMTHSSFVFTLTIKDNKENMHTHMEEATRHSLFADHSPSSQDLLIVSKAILAISVEASLPSGARDGLQRCNCPPMV